MVRIVLVLLIIYLCICIVLYFIQERLIFFPEKTAGNFDFDIPYEEITIRTNDNVSLNGVLFTSDTSKGLVFYLHGNAGSIAFWADVAPIFTNVGYDVFLVDYRGYGKSEGKITNEEQLHTDVQAAFDMIKNRYQNRPVVILGYSLGSGLAAKLAAENDCNLLILQAAYYSLTRIMYDHYRILPPAVLKYKLETHRYIGRVKAPVVMFHGRKDELIGYNHALLLQKLLKDGDKLITLDGQGHNGMSTNPEYLEHIERLLR